MKLLNATVKSDLAFKMFHFDIFLHFIILLSTLDYFFVLFLS